MRIVRSSGNVFADLRLADANEKQTKVRLAVAIKKVIARRRLSQVVAARCLGVNQPKVSELSNYRLQSFSVERLISFLTRFDHDVESVIRKKPASRKSGRVLVSAA